jgi:hypothetical protein
MSTVTTAQTALIDTLNRVRRSVIAGTHALILHTPKILNLRRSDRAWTTFRALLGIFGAALVILPLSFWSGYQIAIVGLAMFITAILLPPAQLGVGMEEKARELGALTVLDGGLFLSENTPGTPINFFVAPENVWVLDVELQPLLVLPVAEITYIQVEQYVSGWRLNVRCMGRIAAFAYSGVFAEQQARVAESAILNAIDSSRPTLPRRRAATA